ncbi:MAG TPA: RNB domain-containing ribonuclease [Jatrophihabitans sp.]|jgi:exoribonuclease R|uniref:RNB domain-containing ribonuclease n=1 Tax=Jatrophihabitans sp. TaxID=1932789 RepID=UPI002E0BDAD6|nr:RNB domain-containing ribonuclease [Jatrophihabitans sp.]
MTHRIAGAPLDFAALRSELEVPGDFDSAVLADAEHAAASVRLPDPDATDIPFVTIDPAGSRDLDQALHIARDGDGFVVSYAIADVASFVVPGSALDAETHRRGETLYFPDVRVPLHPPGLSEAAASLLPGQIRPAVLWRITLDATGEVAAVDVGRARVRSTAQLDYAGVQRSFDAGTPPASVEALVDVGTRRLALARARHAIDLDLPEQSVEPDGPGGWTLTLRSPLPVERYNAEISLLTGMCAASIMLRGGFGLLRTVPPPDPGAVQALHRAAGALGIDWPEGAAPGDVLDSVDRADPRHVAFIEHAVALLRGSGYTPFDGAPPAQARHSGIGAPYAHVTAPLRRLVDRYGSEICLALHAGTAIPDWVRRAVPALPAQMQQADHRAHLADRAVVDATEAWLLRDRVGERFDAVVIDADERAGTVVLDEPAVRARCTGPDLPVGERIRVRLVTADVEQRDVHFERAWPTRVSARVVVNPARITATRADKTGQWYSCSAAG